MRAKRISGGSFVLVLVLAGFLGACSSDDGDDDAGTGAGATDDSTAPSGEQAGPLDEPLEAYAGEASEVYADPASWLCRPDTTDDVCDQDLDLTVVEADGTTSVEAFEPVEDAPVDCFYVYPTISRDETTNSDMDASPEEEGFAALNQVARLAETCRVFAPIYRQTTLTALSGAVSGGGGLPAEAGEMAYGDVLDAWEHYLATDNEGRGVILVGHSQGSAHLSRLVAEEIDPSPEVRDRLVAAYLAGWGVDVPAGEVVGGSFDEVPLCEANDQVGCVASWASFRTTAPPPDGAFFGRSRSSGEPAACTNPADLAGGTDGEAVELAPCSPPSPRPGSSRPSAPAVTRSRGSTRRPARSPRRSWRSPACVTGRCDEVERRRLPLDRRRGRSCRPARRRHQRRPHPRVGPAPRRRERGDGRPGRPRRGPDRRLPAGPHLLIPPRTPIW